MDATLGPAFPQVQLTLCMTRRMSLHKWSEIGILDRELALYQQLHARGVEIAIVSYGGQEDVACAKAFPWLRLCHNAWGLPRVVYEKLVPLLHASTLARTTWFKTNQASGGYLALRLAQRFNRPLIARMGYVWSSTEARQHGGESREAREAAREEQALYGKACRIVVTTPAMMNEIAQSNETWRNKIRIVPNFVDTQQFVPQVARRPEFDLVYVGRLAAEKNIDWLLRVSARLNLTLLILGGAEQAPEWRDRLAAHAPRVTWVPRVEHADMPSQLRRAKIFVFPTRGEGHPKAMLEALATGLPVVTTEVPGVRELVQHGETAWICRPDECAFEAGVQRVHGDSVLQQRLGERGRARIEEQFSLDRIVTREISVLQEMGPSGEFAHDLRCQAENLCLAASP